MRGGLQFGRNGTCGQRGGFTGKQKPHGRQALKLRDQAAIGVRLGPSVRPSQAVYGVEFVLPDHALVPVGFIFDSILGNSTVEGQQPNDSVLTLRFAIDPRSGKEFDSLLGAVSVDEHENIAF
jgi:hypothetical protein